MKVICKTCDKEFDKFPNQINKTINNFCSRSCSATYNNKIYPKRKWCGTKCLDCGRKLSTKNTKRCQGCRRKYTLKEFNSHTLKEKLLKGGVGSHKYVMIRTRARDVLKLEGRVKECEHCEWNKHVNVCHIKAISSFSLDTLISEINSPNNLKYLCPNCHWEMDHK